MTGMNRGGALVELLRLAKRTSIRSLVLISTFSAVDNLTSVLYAFWLKLVLDAAVDGDRGQLLLTVAGLGLAGVVQGVSGWLRFTFETNLVDRIAHLVDLDITAAFNRVDSLDVYERSDIADEVEVLSGRGQAIGNCLSSVIGGFGLLVSTVTTFWLLGSVSHILLALPVLGIFPLVRSARNGRIIDRSTVAVAEDQRRARHVYELLTTPDSAKEIRLYSVDRPLRERLDALNRSVDWRLRVASLRAGLVSGAGHLAFGAGYVLALVWVGHEVLSGSGTIGDFVLVLALGGRINSLLSRVTASAGNISSGLHNVARYRKILTAAESYGGGNGGGRDAPVRLHSGIVLEDVSYTYDSRNEPAVRCLNAHFPAGSSVVLVGSIGAGKSTVVRLLSKLCEPSSGRILVDGVDLRSLSTASWRDRMAALFQDYSRMEFSLRDDVGLGDLTAGFDRRRIESAMASGGAEQLVAELPGGLDTQLGRSFSDGVDLSGGQWQRVGISRSMMRSQPLLLIMDEPSSALDADAEERIFLASMELSRRAKSERGAITILVSHRFASAKLADLVVVLDRGEIREMGAHDELLSLDGAYAAMYRQQADGYR